MWLSKWLPCDFEQCHPPLWGGGILVDHWSTISSCHSVCIAVLFWAVIHQQAIRSHLFTAQGSWKAYQSQKSVGVVWIIFSSDIIILYMEVRIIILLRRIFLMWQIICNMLMSLMNVKIAFQGPYIFDCDIMCAKLRIILGYINQPFGCRVNCYSQYGDFIRPLQQSKSNISEQYMHFQYWDQSPKEKNVNDWALL